MNHDQVFTFQEDDDVDNRLEAESKVQNQNSAINPLNFNALNKNSIIAHGFSAEAPKYRRIAKGINLEGTCRNSNCEANGKRVWIMKEFGTFIMNAETCFQKCPACQVEDVDEVNNIGFYKTTLKVDGQYMDKRKVEMEFSSTDHQFRTFTNSEEQQTVWKQLRITAKPLS